MFPEAHDLPRVNDLFRTAETRLAERLKDDITDDHVRGFDEFFEFLDVTAQQFKSVASLRPLAVLLTRIRKDFETGIISCICGMDQAAFDAMRDVMEVGYLLRDFTLDQSRIADWLAADDRQLRNRFSPNALRQRFANSHGIPVTDLLDSKEYASHSAMLHVSSKPESFVQRGVCRSPLQEFGASFALADILYHARDIVFFLNDFTPQFSPDHESQDKKSLVPHLREAFEHTMTRYRRTLIAIDVAGAFAKGMEDDSGQITKP